MIVLRRERQASPRFALTRQELRDLARLHNVKRGRNTLDTYNNLIAAGVALKHP